MPMLCHAAVGDHLAGRDGVAEAVAVIGLVRQQMIARQVFDERFRLRHVALLAGGEDEAQGIAEAIYGNVDLARQAAATSSDGLILSPPFAPALC